MNGNGKSKVLSVKAAIRRYLFHLEVLHYSPETLHRMKYHLGIFEYWCGYRGLLEVSEITKEGMREYLAYLYHSRKNREDKPISAASLCNLMWPVRKFFKYLSRENLVLFNPALEIELPRKEKRLPRNIFSISEIDYVLNAVDVDTDLGVRDRAILEVLYSTGMRRAEVVRLRVGDVDIDEGLVRIREGKGRKDRVVPIGERAIKWLERYLYDVRPLFEKRKDEEGIFLSKHGDSLNMDWLTKLTKKYIRKSGVNKNGACHSFRHAFATHLLEAGVDVRYIQSMLGHENLESTMIYTRVSIGKLKEIHERFHPGRVKRKVRAGAAPARA